MAEDHTKGPDAASKTTTAAGAGLISALEDYIKSDAVDEMPAGDAQDAPSSGFDRTTILNDRQRAAYREQLQEGLPAERGFPIQIGSELFRLSGASIMSDSPSYFSKFFEEQIRQHGDGNGNMRTLFIDRDPATFQDIACHLQGYFVAPRDGKHYVRLFADAQFYSLPRLIKQLFESEIFIEIGDENFKIPRDIFSQPGDSPNFFTLGFAQFFNGPEEVFPGLDRVGLFRPPPIAAPNVHNKSSKTFSELFNLLRGYDVEIRNENHRAELVEDCRYYHFRGLEQRLINHSVSFNTQRKVTEITLRIEDIKQSGLSFRIVSGTADNLSSLSGWVQYARPFADGCPHDLILEIGNDALTLNLAMMRVESIGESKARLSNLLQVIANKIGLPAKKTSEAPCTAGTKPGKPKSPGETPLSEDKVKVLLTPDTCILENGAPFAEDLILSLGPNLVPDADQHKHKRKRADTGEGEFRLGTWVVKKGQWRLRVQPESDPKGDGLEVILQAVKLDVISSEKARNVSRGFLNP